MRYSQTAVKKIIQKQIRMATDNLASADTGARGKGSDVGCNFELGERERERDWMVRRNSEGGRI